MSFARTLVTHIKPIQIATHGRCEVGKDDDRMSMRCRIDKLICIVYGSSWAVVPIIFINTRAKSSRTIPTQHWETVGDREYMLAWDHILLPIARQWQPDLVIVSAGFDAVCTERLDDQRSVVRREE